MKKFLGNLFVALFLFTLWMGTMGETAMAKETGNLEKQTQWILISSKKVGKVYMDENSVPKKGNLALVETKVEPADGGTPTYLYQVMNREQKKICTFGDEHRGQCHLRHQRARGCRMARDQSGHHRRNFVFQNLAGIKRKRISSFLVPVIK